MRLPFLRRGPDREAQIFSEAQALLDDGLERDFVLSLFPDDAEWLTDLLETSIVIGGAYAGEEPSYYFEASLKAKFLTGQFVPEVVSLQPIPAARFSPVRTAFASVVVLIAATGLGGVIFGFVTSDDSVPGDWNYAFKLAGERLEYSLSRGDSRLDVQINHAEARVFEIQQLSEDGNLTKDAIDSFTRELANLLNLATGSEFGPVQTAKTNSIHESARQLLTAALEKDDSLKAPVAEAFSALDEVLAAASGGVDSLPTPTAEPEATETAIVEPEATEAATVEPDVVEPEATEAATAEPDVVEPDTTESATVEPDAVEPDTAEPATVEPDVVGPDATPATVEPDAPVE